MSTSPLNPGTNGSVGPEPTGVRMELSRIIISELQD
jgi:hypothetical protein